MKLRTLTILSLFTLILFFGTALVFSLISPPVYGQTAGAWNIHRQGAGNDLNFYYGLSGLPALQLNTNGEARLRKIYDLDSTTYTLDPSATSNLTALNVAGFIRTSGSASPPTTGSGIEMFTASNVGSIQTYNRTSSAYIPLKINGSSLQLNAESGGNVGIGTTTPGQLLQIGSSSVINSSGVIRQGTCNSNCTGNRVWDTGVSFPQFGNYGFNIKDVGMSTPAFNIAYGTGNVGIGTTNPQGKFAIGFNDDDQLLVTSPASDVLGIQSLLNGQPLGTYAEQYYRINLQPTLGYVGIGTNDPTAYLHVSKGLGAQTGVKFTHTNLTQGVEFGYTGMKKITTNGQNDLLLDGASNGNVQLNSTATGNVGIGTTSTYTFGKLTVNVGGEDSLNIYKPGEDMIALQTTLNAVGISGYGGDAAQRLILQPVVGNVGIGTYNPAYKLHVVGNGSFTGEVALSTIITYALPAISAPQSLCRDGTNGRMGSCGSDRRLKENIKTLDVNALDLINKLKPSTFKFKSGGADQSGFIAQDVLEVIPEAVIKSSDGMYALNDMIFTPYLVKASQELNVKNQQLQAQVSDQQKQINDLKVLIGRLESKLNEQ